MKKLLFYIMIFILSSQDASSQRNKLPQNLPRYDFKKMHFGFTIGINSLDFKIKYNPEILLQDSLYVLESNNQKGFNLGIVSNFRLDKYTDLRFVPSLIFGERHLMYSFSDSNNLIIIDKKPIGKAEIELTEDEMKAIDKIIKQAETRKQFELDTL